MAIQDITAVVSRLRARLEPLEGANQLSDRLEGQQPRARRAAVLLALFEREGETHILFIRRSSSLRTHSGEIAFPGGGFDPGDDSLLKTALREAQEEIGLEPARVEVLGMLNPVFTVVSNYLIVPVIAWLPRGPGILRLQASEVSELLLLPLAALAEPSILHTEEWIRDGQKRTVYFYDYGPYRIWGATARILTALLEVLTDV